MKRLIVSAALALATCIALHAQQTPAGKVNEQAEAGKQPSLGTLLPLYFDIKNALVQSDAGATALKAGDFLNAIKAMDAGGFTGKDQKQFIKLKDNLAADAGHMAGTGDVEKQRGHFASFSLYFYALAKQVRLTDKPVYQEYCPMKKVYWLSEDPAIKNPYYGSAMLTCGSVTDTLK